MAENQVLLKVAEIISSGLVGAAAAYAFNLFHWHSTEKIRKIESLCNSIASITEKIEENSIRYWLTPPPSNDVEAASSKQLEISIKSLLRTQSSLTDKLSNIASKKSHKPILAQAKKLNGRLFDLSTGDEFESKSRKVRPNKCNNISRACAEIRFNLADLSI